MQAIKQTFVCQHLCSAVQWHRLQGRSSARNLPHMQGQGKIRAAGFFTIERTCPTCHGQGQVISEACGKFPNRAGTSGEDPIGYYSCWRRGRTRVAYQARVRLASMAHRPETYIFLSQLHRTTSSNGTVLTSFVSSAALHHSVPGRYIEVPTVDGSRARITIHRTQSGHQFRLKAKGMSILRSKSGETCLCKPQWRRRLIYQKQKSS